MDLTGSGISAVLSLGGCTSANARPIGCRLESRGVKNAAHGVLSEAWADGCDTFQNIMSKCKCEQRALLTPEEELEHVSDQYCIRTFGQKNENVSMQWSL